MHQASLTYANKPTHYLHLKPHHRIYDTWHSITGTDTIPVTEPKPMFRYLIGVGLVSIYMVDLPRLPDDQLAGLLIALALHFNATVHEVITEISLMGLPIIARNCDPPILHTP